MRSHLVVLTVLLLAVTSGCSDSAADSGTSTATAVENGLTWGDGEYGVVLAHGAAYDAASWEDQAQAIADQGATVVAVEDTSPEALADAVTALQDDGHPDVALVGGSAGADAILQLSVEQPDLAHQLLLISPNTVVEGLGDQPKLLVASEDEPGAAVPQELADASPGEDDEVLLVPGSAHAQAIFDTGQGDVVLEAMLERLAR